MMKKIMRLITVCLMIIHISGCEKIIRERAEIEEHLFIRTVGLDKADHEDCVNMTIISKIVEAGATAEATRKQAYIVTEEGRTLFEANRKFNAVASKDVFWGHLQYIIIGEAAAKEGLSKYLDFIIRDHETRLTPNVLIVRGVTAREAIEKINTKEFIVSDRLKSLFENHDELSISEDMVLAEIIHLMDHDYTSVYIPCIQLVHRTPWEEIMEELGGKKEYDPMLAGYAVFKEGKLIGYLTEHLSRGLNWVNDKVEGGVIVVEDDRGNQISLEIIDAKVKKIPKIKEDNLSIIIEVEMSSNIVDYEGKEDIFKEEALKDLENKQEKVISEEIEKAIEYAKENGVDILGIGDAVFHKYPVEWNAYKDNWQEDAFKEVPIRVSVKSKINRSYVIKEAIGSQSGVKK